MSNVVICGLLLIVLLAVSLIFQILAALYCFEESNLASVACTISQWAPSFWAPAIVGNTICLILLIFKGKTRPFDIEKSPLQTSGMCRLK